ncbi:MAG TPA: quinolinate synthase NadA, partial [Stellaceae bacterium]
MSEAAGNAAAIELTAVLVAVTGEEPRVLTIQDGKALPSGPFESEHRTLQTGLRAWVERQTHHPLGYIEQLYTFADRDRTQGGRSISISYLGLAREARASGDADPGWRSWYRYLPWEDWRSGAPAVIQDLILPQLRRWAADSADPAQRRERAQRIDAGFGTGERSWNEELVLQRYELLYEAGLVPEAARDAVILAHNYQTPEIFHCVADIKGDSLQLAVEATRVKASTIVQCGVHFMA